MWIQLVLWVATTVASIAFREKPEKPKPGKLDVPTTAEGTNYTVLFGTRWISHPVIAWWGDTKTVAIRKKGGKK